MNQVDIEISGTNSVWVIGHKNPDTDSVCAAIAYAELKNRTGDGSVRYDAKTAGEINSETKYVLDFFGVIPPSFAEDVKTTVSDITIRHTAGVKESITLKKAWELMQTEKVATLPIVSDTGKIIGVVSNNDIATSYMDVTDETALSQSRARYMNIVETLNGTVLTGNEHGYFIKGKVEVAAGNKDRIGEYLEKDDLVILGDREQMQKKALAMDVSCMIVCGGAQVSADVLADAKSRECVLISTPYDTYNCARLINQSMPIKSIMTKDNLITFYLDDHVDDVKEVMSKERHRDFPVLDENGNYVGMISRRNFLGMKRKQVILVDHNEKSQAVSGIEEANILEIIDHHRLGNLETMSPVFFRNQPVGSTSTIVYQMYKERGVVPDKPVSGMLCAAIISDTLLFKSPTCTKIDRDSAEELSELAEIDMEEFAGNMFKAASDFGNKSIEEIAGLDYKLFKSRELKIGVSQVMGMNDEDLGNVKTRLISHMDNLLASKKVDLMYVILTNILTSDSEVLCAGEDAKNYLERAFGVTYREGALIKGLVSRKKQFVPKIIEVISE